MRVAMVLLVRTFCLLRCWGVEEGGGGGAGGGNWKKKKNEVEEFEFRACGCLS